MTFWDVAATMARRWYVTLVSLCLAVTMWLVLARDGGCFTTSTIVSFTLPSRTTLLPESGAFDESVIAFAGVVAHEINGGHPAPRYASSDAPLYGVGVRKGVLVGLPDSGGQWTTSFTKAEIEIQIVARTYDEVKQTQDRLLRRVMQITRDQQRTASSNHRIGASVMPLTSTIREVAATRSSQLLALVALAIAAIIVGGWATLQLDRGLAAKEQVRRNPHTPLPPTSADEPQT